MSKHSSSENSNGDVASAPQAKRPRMVEFEPVRICSISGVKDIDNRVLKAQHYKLCERFRVQERLRQILEKRVEELESRQAKDDEVSCIINRYWNRLDEDVQLLLQRFDADATTDVEERADADENVKHFLTVLSNWSVEEVDEKLTQRVEFTRRALSKLVQVFDKVVERNTRLCSLISGEKDPFNPSRLSSPDDSEKSPEVPESPKKELIEEELRNYTTNILNENVKLQRLVTKFQAENHRLTLESAGKDDQISVMENRVENYSNKCEDAQYELSKALSKYEKLDYRLAEYIRKEQTLQVQAPSVEKEKQQNGTEEDMASIGKAQLEELQQQLDFQTELANNRLQELQEMTEKNKSLASELETSEMKLKYLPPDQVAELPEYICLQTNYSYLLNDCRALRHEVEEMKQQMNSMKQTHAKQIEKMKAEAAAAQERMNESLLDLDNQLSECQKEYENLCIEFEQSNAASESAGPINEQVLQLMKTFSTQNDQLKSDVRRYKRKYEEAASTLIKCQKELEAERKINNDNYIIIKLEEEPPEITSPDPHTMADGLEVKHPMGGTNGGGEACNNKHPECAPSGSRGDDSMDLKPLKKELNTSEEFNFASPTGSSNERRLKLEVEKLKSKLREITKAERKEKLKYYSDEAKRKIRSLEEQCEKLRKELTNAKQEEEGLMTEMEATGQAFEDMQEQNQRLVQQLREKDDANLNLMGERIRNNQAQKKIKEEQELQNRLLIALNDQMDAKTLLCLKLEEKEKALMENRTTLEHELKLKDHTIELLRRKATEATQSATDLKLRLEKLTTQFNDVQQRLKKKASSFEAMSMNIKRMEEEQSRMKRQIERAKRMEKYDNFDKVLEEENRLLKEVLTCPSCKVNRKDAIILKCSHTFCMACLKRRYECRSRKCPTCSQAFSQQDFRRIYLE